jgi:hypothetical protein
MRSLAEWAFDVGYRKEWYLPIRDDFIRWYSFAWDHPMVRQSLSDENLPQLTYRAGRSAIHFDPNNPIVDTVDLIDIYLEKIQTVRAYAEVIGVGGLVVSGIAFMTDFGVVIPGVVMTVSLLILAPPAIFRVLVHQMRTNIELIKMFNRELVKLDMDVWTNRNPRYRSAYFLWNRSLNKPKVFPVLAILAVLRGFSPYLYGMVNEGIRENMTDYIDEGVWDVTKRELVQLWKDR